MKKILYLLLIIMSFTFTGCGKTYFAADSKNDFINSLSGSGNKETIDKNVLKNNANNKKNRNLSKEGNLSSIAKTTIALVNRSHIVDKNFTPASLTIPNVRFASYANSMVRKMDAEASKALEDLFKSAKADGIKLIAVSGYRDYSYQEMLYNNKVASAGEKEADKYVAKPGTSEHQTGLAMDVLSTEYTSLDEGFSNTDAYKWLVENSYKYGFIIRYPKGKENITGYNYEPWHIRYVGIYAAAHITNQKTTLEEYLDMLV